MTVRQLVPEALADIPPGPELARVLAGLEPSRLSGFDCVEVLKAQYRQANHERARLLAVMAEVGLCGVGPAGDELAGMPVPDEFSADEIRAALVLTRRAADAVFWLAHDLTTRLPAVHAGMDSGLIDEPRARILSDWTTGLSTEQARAVCDALLPEVPHLTTGQLIEKIKKLAIAIDPQWARRRYEQAIADRKVVGSRNPDSSANLSGLNLPVDRVAAACAHIDTLAKTAKHTGDPRPIDHIRADLFLGMTDGTYTGLDDTTIVERLRATRPGDEAEPGSDDAVKGPGPGDGATTGQPARQPAPGRAGSELRVQISTLLGHENLPGELAGWRPLHAELARDLAGLMARGQWRFAITDEHGRLGQAGITRARPAGWARRAACSREIVELQIPATVLRQLAADLDALGNWAPVITDLAHQHASALRPAGDPGRYTPSAAVRRWVRVRDQRCIMIGCRAPARGTDTDHTRDAALGGTTTTDDNLDAVCRHHHRVKHEGGWTLHQPEAGTFRWTSRLGHIYHRHPPTIIEPLPEPIPAYRPPYSLITPADDGWEGTQIWERIWEDTAAEPDPPPEHDPRAGPPPF